MVLKDGPFKQVVDCEYTEGVVEERFERIFKSGNLLKRTTTVRRFTDSDYIDSTTTDVICEINLDDKRSRGLDTTAKIVSTPKNRDFDEYGFFGENNPPVGHRKDNGTPPVGELGRLVPDRPNDALNEKG